MPGTSNDNLQPQRLGQYALIVAVASLIVAAIASRFLLLDWPNFKPVFAIAIFIGFLCQNRLLALASVAVILLVSDSLIGFYEWPLMLTVYGSMLIACFFGMKLRGRLLKMESVVGKTLSIAVASITGSVIFFLLTNGAVWLIGWYPANVGGLLQSMIAGLPFFKFTVAGDLFFSLLLFAAYYTCLQSLPRLVRKSGTRSFKFGNERLQEW